MADSGNNMTISINQQRSLRRKRTPSPVIAYANWFQFRPGERFLRPRVESRMFLAVQQGAGTLTINGEEHAAGAGCWFFLPWAHAVEYAADEADPFLVGGIHVIPDHDPNYPVRNRVAHDQDDPLAGARYRRDTLGPCGRGLLKGFFPAKRCRLGALVDYVIESFDPGRPNAPKQRQAAEWLLAEIAIALKDTPASGSRPVPASLLRAEAHVRRNLQRALDVSALARAGHCSIAGVHRLFRRWHDVTPAKWVARQRAERAAYLLRTTRSPLKAIAEEVGINDPFQFSRFFRRMNGLPPREYRKRQGIL
jgi:AraC-like DNA-binding protein